MEKTNTLISSTLSIGLVALVVGIGIGYVFGMTRYGVPGQGMHMMQNGMMMQNERMSQDVDQHFIVQMIPHHEMAVMMASMLAASTERAEMETLADAIITSQSREIETMRSWRASWYPRN